MYRVGIDLGGTNIVAGIVDDDFNIVAKASRKTNAPRKDFEIVDDMVAAVNDALSKCGLKLDDISEFGVGSPGSIDTKTGEVIYANNLNFYNVKLADLLFERTGKKFYIANDANAAAYGEYIAGAGKGTESFVMITLGTGVGGGIVLDGKILSGFNGAGAELGHTVIQMNGERCTCGRNGCFEAYASATALINQTKQAMARYPKSVMWELCGNDINAVNGLTSFDAMRKGDIAGTDVVNNYITYLSVGIANLINTFQPEVFCIGGGVSKEGDYIIKPLKKLVSGENYARLIEKKVDIKTAELGNDAGIIGAAYLYNSKD